MKIKIFFLLFVFLSCGSNYGKIWGQRYFSDDDYNEYKTALGKYSQVIGSNTEEEASLRNNAIRKGCIVLAAEYASSNNMKDFWYVLKTLPMDIEQRKEAKKYVEETMPRKDGKPYIYFFDNGGIFVKTNVGEFIYPHHKYFHGLLYNPFGISGLGYLKKASTNYSFYELSKLLNTDKDKLFPNQDYDLACGASISLDNDNLSNYFDIGDSSYEAYETKSYEIQISEEKAKRNKEIEDSWKPYVKKYGAQAVARVRNGEIWVGEPAGLATINKRHVQSYSSYGKVVDVYQGYKAIVWISGGRVIKFKKGY